MASVVRVVVAGRAAFQLRSGEAGISVFDPDAVVPPLTEQEILDEFRSGSHTLTRTVAEIEAKSLRIDVILGAETLPERLRRAHREIHPGAGMNRKQFKNALKELE